MLYTQYTDALRFYDDVIGMAQNYERECNILLRNVIACKNGYAASDWYMARITEDNGETLLIALMTPPYGITLCLAENTNNSEILEFLCDRLIKDGIFVPGINAVNETAEEFAKIFTGKTGQTYRIATKLRVYSLHNVSGDIVSKPSFRFRIAYGQDLAFLPYWKKGFMDDCFPDETPHSLIEAYDSAKGQIEGKRLYVLEDNGVPVSLVGYGRETIKSQAIANVYTPPFNRNKGYAAACVSELCRKILEDGYEYALLFADLQNPISNGVYQKIGFKPVCDCLDLRFAKL